MGVELGQLAIVAAFLPLAFRLRATTFHRVGVLQAGSVAVAVAVLASWWFVERAFDLAPVHAGGEPRVPQLASLQSR